MRLLLQVTFTSGGMADYVHQQACALAAAGVEVTLLCPSLREGPWWGMDDAARPYRLRPVLRGVRRRPLPGWLRKPLFARDLVADGWMLAAEVRRGGFTRVLFGAFYEYLAPLWTPPLRWLAKRKGVVFGSVVHDPARDYLVGPRWWHRRSTGDVYQVLREAFVHEPVELDTVRPVPGLRTTVIPHGPYPLPTPKRTREAISEDLGLPAGARVLLSYGYVRDGKNLDLVLRAVREHPGVFLVVAGREQNSSQRPVSEYQRLAEELGVAGRCRWLHRHIPDMEAAELLQRADLLLLTYSAQFRSASGVLNNAVAVRVPCLASSGPGNLRSVVQGYGLGLWVEPDRAEAIVDGIGRFLRGEMPRPRWEDYERENSWAENARLVRDRMMEDRQTPR